MNRLITALAFLTITSPLAWSCWNMIEPAGYAADCPVIVTATIESVKEAAPGGQRSDDVASLRIDKVHRNDLKDVALKAGDLFAVKMISKNNSQRTSTDLNYPAKTKAVWLIVLTRKGEFRIDVHPVQKQPADRAPPLGRIEQSEIRVGAAPSKFANPNGSKTTAEWIAWVIRQEEQRVKSIAAHNAQQKAIRDLAKEFAEAKNLDETLWTSFKDADIEVRRGVLLLSIQEQPMSGSRFAEVAQGVLQREKDDNVRTHAVSQLAYCRDPGVEGMKVLAAALRDRSANVRLFACQAVKFRRYETLAEQVKALQNDADRQVREMATDTLEFWRKKPASRAP